MKITDLTVSPVAFPDPPLRNSTGVHQPYALRNIVQVETDEGVGGAGEAPGGEAAQKAIEAVRDQLVGHDARNLESLRLQIDAPSVYSAIEVACLDALGKALGLSASQLLGGPVRDRVEFSAYLFFKYEDGNDDWGRVMDPEALLGEARRFHETWGFRCHKLKGGVLSPDQELETLRLLRQHFGPTHELRVDPNGVWSVGTSIRCGNAMEELGVEYLEDPCTGMVRMADIRQCIPVPLSTNSVVTSWEHLADAVDLGPVDVVLSDHHYWGGLMATKFLGKICETFGFGVGMHSNSHLGISMAAMIHAAAVTPQITYACDTHYPWLREDIIQGPMFRFRNGCLDVPAGPGLGVEIDPDKLAKFHENYVRFGHTRRDDEQLIRQYEPDWVVKFPRW
jgi:glucarate dehydratase